MRMHVIGDTIQGGPKSELNMVVKNEDTTSIVPKRSR